MSERGTFAVDRGIFGHPLFAGCKPYSRREAWLWMLSEAGWKDRQRDLGGQLVTLRRGEFAASVRYMAEAWGWSRSAVGRFLDRLKSEKMVRSKTGTQSGTASLVVSICNYDAFQWSGGAGRDSDRDSSGTVAGQIKERKTDSTPIVPKGTRRAKSANGYGDDTHPLFAEFATEVWAKRWTREGNNRFKAYASYSKLNDTDRAAVRASIARCTRQLEVERPEAKYRPMLQTWINSRGWEADAPAHAENGSERDSIARWVAHHRSTGKWNPALGPAPGQLGCRIPADLLIATAASNGEAA